MSSPNNHSDCPPSSLANVTPVPFNGDLVHTIRDEHGVWVIVKRVCEALILDEEPQRKKLKTKPWAVTSMKEATGPDGKTYEMFAIHLDCLPMWLATIDLERVTPETRAKLERYQIECAKVLRDFWFGPVRGNDNVGVVEEQVARLIMIYRPALDEGWIRKNVEHGVARIRGVLPETTSPRLVDTSTFLVGKGHSADEIRSIGPQLGKQLKKLYTERHGKEPGKCLRLVNGSEREVFSYDENDLPLFEQAYRIVTKAG